MNKWLIPVSVFYIIITSFFSSCQSGKKEVDQVKVNKNALFSILSHEETGISFKNTIEETDSVNIFSYLYLYNGSGVATGDINNDGLPDIYFSGNQQSGRLYLNKGNFKFEDITEKAGVSTNQWCTGVAMADINNDGFLDIYVSKSGKFNPDDMRLHYLFINNKDNTFTEKSEEFGLKNSNYTTQATFFDIDNDGDLDLFQCNEFYGFNQKFVDYSIENTKYTKYTTPRMFENIENKKFADISQKAGVMGKTFLLSATPGDINKDGYTDLYVCNDFVMPDKLYINNKDKSFTNKLDDYIKHTSYNSMGSDVADFNNDANLDIVVLDMTAEDNRRQKIMMDNNNYDTYNYFITQGYGEQMVRNVLQLNNGNGSFSEIGHLAGISFTDWSWAPLFADFDYDGFKDLFVSNGYRKDYNDKDFILYKSEETRKKGKNLKPLELIQKEMPEEKIQNYMFKNKGDLTFKKVSDEWGLTQKNFSYGAAYADLDNDGDLDLIVCNTDDFPYVYKNNLNKQDSKTYLKINLRGDKSNYFGIGCKVKIKSKSGIQYQELFMNRGFQSTVEPILYFGFDKEKTVEEVEVIWPSGKMQILKNVNTSQTITINEKDADLIWKPENTSPAHIFVENATQLGIDYKHKENDFIDFKREPLIPHMCSRNGPGISVADVNGDKLDDFFVGAAQYGGGGVLYIQTKNGKFAKSNSQPWMSDTPGSEDMGSLFFDADGDGDNDLYIVSGGSENEGYSPYFQDRLYFNDGKGNFKLNTSAIPLISSSGSPVVACDFDNDGDNDLFVGGRILSGQYPLPPRSYILKNNNGVFSDATKEVCSELLSPGLVSSALWSDFNNDGKTDLIVTGEWMPIMMLQNTGKGTLVNTTKKAGLDSSNGWWNSLTAADFDKDGDMDYVAGNKGLNSQLKAFPKEPVCVYLNDYDQNKSLDAVLCYYVMGTSYPLASRDQLTVQMRGIRKQFLKHHDYAEKTIDQIFSKESLKSAKVFNAFYFQSSIIENLGNGKFKVKPLPVMAQMAPVYGTQICDYNQDGNTDILMVGNSYQPQAELGRDDAFTGLILKGDGKGNFSPVISSESGFFARNDAKSLSKIKVGHKLSYLVGNNNDKVQLFQFEKSQRWIELNNNDVSGEFIFSDGGKQKFEISQGCGYLSQNTRNLDVPNGVSEISLINSKGEKRVLK